MNSEPITNIAPLPPQEPTAGTQMTYFIPEYGVSVQATSLDDAVAKAKKSKKVEVKNANA